MGGFGGEEKVVAVGLMRLNQSGQKDSRKPGSTRALTHTLHPPTRRLHTTTVARIHSFNLERRTAIIINKMEKRRG